MTDSDLLQDANPGPGSLSALPRAIKSGKRKRSDRDQQRAHKRSRSTKSAGGEGAEKGGRNLEIGINEDIARMDGRLLSDYVAQKAKYFEKHLTTLELEDKFVSGTVS